VRLAQAIWDYFPSVLSVGPRVHPRRLPKDAVLPAVVYQVIPAVGPLKVHSDAHDSGYMAGFHRDRVQWGTWAPTYEQAEELGEELLQHINGFAGMWGDLRVAVLTDLDFDNYAEDMDIYSRVIDCMVMYNAVVRGS
jgi:hypothetical protein